jgi:AraC-like DNA-binding protein
MISLFEIEQVTDSAIRQLANIVAMSQGAAYDFGPGFIESVVLALAMRLLRVYHSRGRAGESIERSTMARWRLDRALDFIESNLESSITVADIGKEVGLSGVHFAAQFKKAVGQPPHAYILRRRVERAKELLVGSQESVVAIAHALGFASQAHFTTVFKKSVGCPPVQWRRLQDGSR